MELDRQRLEQVAPFAIAVVLCALGWLMLVQPRVTASSRAGREIEGIRQRLTRARESVAGPAPEMPVNDAVARFERVTVAGDATAELLEQLARRAAAAQVLNLLIETGQRVADTTGRGAGPQATVSAASVPDPRLALFGVSVAYSPLTMSFDADYAHLGDFLWQMRDLATTMEIRRLDVSPSRATAADGVATLKGKVHVSMTLFAYARERSAGASRAMAGSTQ